MNIRLSRSLLVVSVVALLSACATPGPKVRVNSDPAARIAQYRTFNFFEQLGTDREGYESLVSASLKDATTAELTKRGYKLAANPDFLVNFGGKLDDKLRVSSRPAMIGPAYGYYGYRRGFYDPWGGYDTVDVDQYTQGTLNIDIVDAASKRLVWEAVAVGRVTEEVRDDIPAAVRAVVPQMLEKFPSAGGAATANAMN